MKLFILITIINFSFILTVLADSAESGKNEQEIDSKYKNYIKEGVLKRYTKTHRQLNIIKKFSGNPEQAHLYRKKAAYIAIDSGKCDYVNSADVVGELFLQYEVICQNGAIIYLTETDIKQHFVNSDSLFIEEEKALPRAVAKSRCKQLINNYAFNHHVTKEQLIIDRYKISTWITALGLTHVIMGFSMNHAEFKGKHYKGHCIFNYNDNDVFNVQLVK